MKEYIQHAYLMFDPRFKGSKIVTKYFNSSKMALEMADEYDWKVLLPFLTKGYKQLQLERPQTAL
jgi:hypothetical protein